MTRQRDTGVGNGHRQWLMTKDKILLFSGLTIIGVTFITAELLDRPFHIEFLFTGLALCGIGIAQWGDRSSQK